MYKKSRLYYGEGNSNSDQDIGVRLRDTGDGQQATGDGQQATGDGLRAKGNRQQSTGYRQKATGYGLQAKDNRLRATGLNKKNFWIYNWELIYCIMELNICLSLIKIAATWEILRN